MKLKCDFVTNSSSSSFVLCFDEEQDYSDFLKECEEFNYNEFSGFVEEIVMRDNVHGFNSTDKDAVLCWYENYFKHDICDMKRIREDIEEETGLYWWQVNEKDPVFSSLIDAEKEANIGTYNRDISRISNSWLSVMCYITDFDGGFMEWAIRNGFVEREMAHYCIGAQHIG